MKKFIALMLTCVVSVSCSLCCFASTEAQVDQVPDYYTEEYQQEVKAVVAEAEAYLENKLRLRTGAKKYLSVPLYKQIKDYYCGVASAQMVLEFLKAPGEIDQEKLAADDYFETDKKGSTRVYNLVNGLNNRLGSKKYMSILIDDLAFATGLIYSIDAEYPVVCHVDTRKLPAYSGYSCGHYVVATGYNYGSVPSSQSNVRYNDPNYDNKYYGRFDVDFGVMESAIDARSGYYIMKKR